MRGLVAAGVYVPHWRLERRAIGEALGLPAGKGARAVAGYDEDTTSMGVEAARAALRRAPGVLPSSLWFATTDPAYLDKTNATAIHAALGLAPDTLAADMLGSVRSAAGALRAALDGRGPVLVVQSDIRTGLPGGADERDGGDAAVALLIADDAPGAPVLAEAIASASVSAEFLERWRMPGEGASRQWEERFGEHVYVPLGRQALAAALARGGVAAGALARLIVAGPHLRACRGVVAASGAPAAAVGDELTGAVGNTGAAHAGLMLAAAIDAAKPGDLIAVVSLADGADATIWRATGAIGTGWQGTGATAALAAPGGRVGYPAFLSWRGQLRREPPRRPDPEPPEAPPAFRTEAWKFSFTGSRCDDCGTRHLPPQRVCVRCHAVDRMRPERLADVPARVATFTVDRLAFSPSPPVVAAIVDFEGGGRFQCELTDVDPDAVAIGDPVEMTFRRLLTARGVHNYFWKARPRRANGG